jgi:hypothetical protein
VGAVVAAAAEVAVVAHVQAADFRRRPLRLDRPPVRRRGRRLDQVRLALQPALDLRRVRQPVPDQRAVVPQPVSRKGAHVLAVAQQGQGQPVDNGQAEPAQT